MRRLVVAALLGYVVAGSVVRAADPVSIWDGAFTAAQAERGKVQYDTYCSTCHSDDLSGSNGPALAGETFLKNWDAATISELFLKVSRTMPKRQTSLPQNVYYDLVAYLLQANGFPAGTAELQPTGTGMSARVMGKNGPIPVDLTVGQHLVRTVGCLTGDKASGWRLSNATAPVRSRNPDPSAAADLQLAAAEAPGTQTFVLKAVDPGSERQVGQRVEAKGLLIGESIALMSLTGVGAQCGQ